ncbi:MAG TPA: aminotransferase class V-fold PLP-dependent enzyme [Gammaproteobacteria bacterium]|nr:aminotransferase class V-fold PLP-dependent enzyme [Gammaproteobacteria bacterium]
MPTNPISAVDPDGLLEFSVVFTDRSLNHMSQAFQAVMRDMSATLKKVYGAHSVAIVPGGGTYGMESVARQLATGKRCTVLRNGWFSYRWTQIFETGSIPSASTVLQARRTGTGTTAPFAPAPIDEVEAHIRAEKPDLVFAPHVETASGILLPNDYLQRVAAAVHAAGGLFVLDCIASGTLWVDMKALGVDVLITAPQKGWSGTPGAALVMLGERAHERVKATKSTSFAMDLAKWLSIMETYEGGGHAYHATMPTDSLRRLRDLMAETERFGFERARERQIELGRRVRALLAERGFPSVAAPGFEAPCVVVSYTTDADLVTKFAKAGAQVAAGVPLQCGEPADYRAFRIGLFGLDKLGDVDGTVSRLADKLTHATEK